ncbi:hypothetical protein DFH09DRAFT_1276326, partial [Mycena vulgaris]
MDNSTKIRPNGPDVFAGPMPSCRGPVVVPNSLLGFHTGPKTPLEATAVHGRTSPLLLTFPGFEVGPRLIWTAEAIRQDGQNLHLNKVNLKALRSVWKRCGNGACDGLFVGVDPDPQDLERSQRLGTRGPASNVPCRLKCIARWLGYSDTDKSGEDLSQRERKPFQHPTQQDSLLTHISFSLVNNGSSDHDTMVKARSNIQNRKDQGPLDSADNGWSQEK